MLAGVLQQLHPRLHARPPGASRNAAVPAARERLHARGDPLQGAGPGADEDDHRRLASRRARLAGPRRPGARAGRARRERQRRDPQQPDVHVSGLRRRRLSELNPVERIDVAVIGAGVTGLASARAIAATGASVCVLERHPRPGMDTSTHNSGVIHAGIYYPAGSLKAKLCVEGRDLMYAFCARHGVPHVRSGKLIVAHDEGEVHELEALQRRGAANGVTDLEIVDRAFIVGREPAVNTRFALWSPDSGIVNAEEFVKALLRVAAAAGAMFLPGTRLLGADRHADGMMLTTERESIVARVVVNASGLYADDVSQMLGGETFKI